MTDKARRLEILLARRSQLSARIEREKAREAAAARKTDTRRKIVLGGAVLALFRENPKNPILREIGARLSERDKKLFSPTNEEGGQNNT